MNETNASAEAAGCPMASMCKGIPAKAGGLILLPGILMVLVGALVIVQPVVLPWLLGCTSVVLGLAALAIPVYLQRPAKSDG